MRTWPALEVGRLTPAPTTALDLLQAALLDYDVAAVDETAGDLWRVFFHSGPERDAAAQQLAQQFPDLSVRAVDVADEDWAARSQAALRAITIDNLIVAPPWDRPASDLVTIVIQPSMGFGTGHHASTRLCLSALQQLDLRGLRVVDVGTGSGVLALAASRLGAADAIGIDDDPDAIQAARENLALNPGTGVDFRLLDVRAGGLSPCDLVTGNLTGALLIQAASRLHDLTAPGGHLILSGFLAHEETDVRRAYADLALTARSQEDEWVCVTLHRMS